VHINGKAEAYPRATAARLGIYPYTFWWCDITPHSTWIWSAI